jgi:lipopolysaccharide export system protein LptA
MVAAVGLACAVALFVYSRGKSRPTAPASTEMRDPTAQSEQRGMVNVQFKNNKEELKVEAEREIDYSDNRTRLEHAHFTTTKEDRRFEIWADAAESQGKAVTGDQPGQVALKGHLRVETNDGLKLLTDEGTYDNVNGLANLPGRVTFTRGSVSGESLGATYDHDRNVIWLLDQAHIKRAPDETGSGELDATAKAIGIARNEKFINMTEHAVVQQPEQTLTSDNTVIHFTDDEKGVRLVEMHGHASVVPGANAKNPPPQMAGDEITLEFQPDGHALKHGVLTGSASVIQVNDQGARQSIRGAAIDLVTAPDGHTLTNLESKRGAEVVIPPTADTPGRTIRAASLVASGDDKIGLRVALFEGGVTFSEHQLAGPGRPAADRTATSATLALDLKGQLGAIDKASFRQNVTFRDGDMSAKADLGVYDETAGTLELTPAKPQPPYPRVDNGSVRVDALWIRVDIATHDLRGRDKVRTTMTPSKSADGETHTPALFDGDQPVYGSATEMRYLNASRQARFAGAPGEPARVYQDDGNLIVGDRIELDQDSGNLNATGGVSSRFFLQPAEKTNAPKTAGPSAKGPNPPAKNTQPPRPSDAAASTLVYTDADRKAVYTADAPTLATMSGPNGVVEARQLTATLAQKERSLQKLVAQDSVFAKLEGGRETVGSRLIYDADAGTHDISGKPMYFKNVDAKEGRCSLETSPELIYDENTHSTHEPASAAGTLSTTAAILCTTPLKVAIAAIRK